MLSDPHAAHEPHPWVDLTPDQVLEKLVHELYAPVSALGEWAVENRAAVERARLAFDKNA